MTPEGAQLLLQVRTRTLNGELGATFGGWYPVFSLEDQPVDDTPRRLIAPDLSCARQDDPGASGVDSSAGEPRRYKPKLEGSRGCDFQN